MGDYERHVGLGVKCSKEVATAIRGAIILAKLSIIPVRLGYWGNKIGEPHTVPCKVRSRNCYYINTTFTISAMQVEMATYLVSRLQVNVAHPWYA